jgi:hypothetical protein
MLLRVTVILVITPDNPDTPMLDGYGVVTEVADMFIAVGLQKFSVGQLTGLTVTVKEQLEPAALVQVTVVVPTKKNEPDGGEHVTAPQTPVSVGAAYDTIAPHCVGSLSWDIFGGQVSVQGAVSSVVIVKHHPPAMLPISPAESSTA